MDGTAALRMRLKVQLRLAFGVGLILGGILLRVRLAGLDLSPIVKQRLP